VRDSTLKPRDLCWSLEPQLVVYQLRAAWVQDPPQGTVPGEGPVWNTSLCSNEEPTATPWDLRWSLEPELQRAPWVQRHCPAWQEIHQSIWFLPRISISCSISCFSSKVFHVA